MTERLCKVCDGWHDLDEPWPYNCLSHWKLTECRSHLSGPMVIRDTMDPVQSMLDGKMYDSKSVLRRTYKTGGVIEVGGETPKPFKKPKPDRKHVRASLERAFSKVGLGA